MATTLVVNARRRSVNADRDTPLLWVLRDHLGLLGTKYGCGVGLCGACTVLEDGRAVRACQVRLADAAGKRYTTIEGLSPDASHRCQQAWLEEDVAQCGYCQAGIILTTVALLAEKPAPTDADIDAAIDDHVCRCGTYPRIRKAIHRAAAATAQRGK
jgi:aerobic-type carbon monoxide dehydrogenase small subunit (CoxS/CutS family)